jgi:hypothetical protein
MEGTIFNRIYGEGTDEQQIVHKEHECTASRFAHDLYDIATEIQLLSKHETIWRKLCR